MENISMPSNHSEVIFTDHHGVHHRGIYKDVLKAFVDTEGGKDPNDLLNIYPEDNIVEWDYPGEQVTKEAEPKNPDSDIMVIL